MFNVSRFPLFQSPDSHMARIRNAPKRSLSSSSSSSSSESEPEPEQPSPSSTSGSESESQASSSASESGDRSLPFPSMPLGEHLLAPAAEHVDAAASADVSEHCEAAAARADVAPPPSSEAQHAAAVLVGAMKEIEVSPDSFMPYDVGRDTEKDYVSRLMTFVGGRAKHHYDDLLEQVNNLLEQKEKSESVIRVLQAAASSERQVMMKRSRSIEHELNCPNS